MAPLQLRYRTTHLLTIITLLVPFLLTACSSSCNKSMRISRIADQQLVVIDSLRSERKSAEVSSLVQKDATLRHAEAHLTQALESLTKSIQTVKEEEDK